MKVGSLLSGIGGMDLGLERAGMAVIWQSEIDPYASRVLAKHWPHVPNLGDITRIDWSTVERPDLICGGYPCQPFSSAGKRLGADDPRHLWPHMLHAIRVLRPRYALMENVRGHLSLGFGRVLGDLADIGYDAEWSLISACSMGAPHMRQRVFILAHPQSERCGASDGALWSANEPAQPAGRMAGGHWAEAPTADVLGVADGVPGWVDRRRAAGNAVVPQVAEWIGRRLTEVAA